MPKQRGLLLALRRLPRRRFLRGRRVPGAVPRRRLRLVLPLRVLVWQDGEETKIGYLAPDALAARYDITGADETLGKIANALDQMTNKAAAAE